MTYFTRSIPEDQGIHSLNIRDFLKESRKINYTSHSFFMLRHGKVVAEVCRYPYKPEDKRLVYSASKTWTSTVVGLAYDEGLIETGNRVLDYFPEYDTPDLDPRMGKLTVWNLLTMTTGHGKDSIGDMCNGDPDWVRTFFTREVVYEPGEKFIYDSGATYMLSEIVSRVTGMPMVDYIRPRLLEPLEITDFLWEYHGTDVNTGAWGVMVRPEDLAKLGMLYLRKGVWNGKRILSEDWIEQATTRHVATGRIQCSGWGKYYGYQIWFNDENSYRANGAFGQFCMVFPKEDMVIAATSEEMDASRLFPLIEKYLLSELSEKPYARDAGASLWLKQTIKKWDMPVVMEPTSSYLEFLLPARDYQFREVKTGETHSLKFDFRSSLMTFVVDGKQEITASNLTGHDGETAYAIMPPTCSPIIGEEQINRKWCYTAWYEWVNEGTMRVHVCYRESGHDQEWLLVFSGNTLNLVVSNSCKKIFGLTPEAVSDRNKDFADMVYIGESK